MLRFITTFGNSSGLDDGARARDLRPNRGLGVGDGEGKAETAFTRLSGVKERGRRCRLARRGRGDAICGIARSDVLGPGHGIFSGGVCESSSSSSSSSSTSVCSWSLEDEDAGRSLNESRLFAIRVLRLGPKLGTLLWARDGFVATAGQLDAKKS